jgi:hypothetical protein
LEAEANKCLIPKQPFDLFFENKRANPFRDEDEPIELIEVFTGFSNKHAAKGKAPFLSFLL